jgi:adenine phosphoribosyltransferase
MTAMDLNDYIRDIPDFPKPGIVFKDITPLLGNGAALRYATDRIAALAKEFDAEIIAGIESRGFLFGTAVASQLQLGFIPIRKPGKLPFQTRRVEYALEYGTDAVEIHVDAVTPGQRVLLVDDLLATGGTAAASVSLLRTIGATVVCCAFVIELGFLPGRDKLDGIPVRSLITYD